MVVTTHKIFDEIKSYINKKGEPYSSWYVGTADDAFNSLFVQHGVSEKQDFWMYKQCPDSRVAKHIKMTLLKLGCEGWAYGWADSCVYVYVYLKSSNTKP